ncbi:MAG: hypothetical protein WAM91_01375 [Candidatus Acidiferrales bacterium]
MKTRALALAILFVVSATTILAGSDKPLFVSPDFRAELVNPIDVFVADLTNDPANTKECKIGVEIGLFNRANGADITLKNRGYNWEGRRSVTQFYTAKTAPTEAILSNPTKEWLQDLSNQKYFNRKSEPIHPPGRWIMFLTIDEFGSRENAVKGLGGAALSMYLYDRDQGTLLWHDQTSKEHMWAGLMGNIMDKGAEKQATCANLAEKMIRKLPQHKK